MRWKTHRPCYSFKVRLAPTPRAPRFSRAWVIFLFYGALAVAAVVWGALRGDANIFRNHASTLPKMAMSPFLGAAFGLGVVFLSRLFVHRFEWARVLHREFHALVHELSSKEIFTLAVASAVGEELFFRGALLPVVGLLPSTLLFAGLHVRPQARFLPWTRCRSSSGSEWAPCSSGWAT